MRITGGSARAILLSCPKKSTVRPTTDAIRLAIFSALAAAGRDCRGAHFVDLFAGVGSYGLEAMSRGAGSGIFVERDRDCCKAIQKNLAAVCRAARCDQKSFSIRCRNAFSLVATDGPDLLFCDPPYELLRQEPTRYIELLARHLCAASPGAVAILEFPSDLEITLPEPLRQLKTINRSGGRDSPCALFIGVS
ncbi:MAG: RsmD family RNA methyltransferase [Puniceicoccales bacterium]|jgi:16S rRNA (guanine966-N2)-methyltransferase|nr:RsmD family RNA methyltransferase [Puniceicoccales bacterium]